MAVITVGTLCPEQTRINRSGEDRWIKGTVRLTGRCMPLLSEIRQRKLPFTIVTGQVLPKEPAILLGEISVYHIPDTNIDWKTLEIQKFIPKDSALLTELGVSFQEAERKIARKDKEFLEQIGSVELLIRERLTELLGKKNGFVDRFIEQFGDLAIQKLTANPWQMINIIPYFTMKQADSVAEKLGIPLTDERRFTEYFRYLLDRYFENHRNTYMLENEFQAFYWMNFAEEMTFDEYKDLLKIPNSPIKKTNLGYHPAHLYFAEKASFEVIVKALFPLEPFTELEEQAVKEIQENSAITLSDEQVHALAQAFHTPLHIITGGPGTGKTTVLNAIIEKLIMLTGASFAEGREPFLLIAPSGKAAYRMWEQTGVTAHTIHSAFGIIPEYGCLDVRETAKRLSHVRYLIIDESSMLDTKTFGDMCRVLLHMDECPSILLVGDADQLPPVGHGQVFQDLLQFLTDCAPEHVSRLTILKRQKDGSSIPELASYIREGTFPDQSWFEGRKDVFFVPSTMNDFQHLLVEGILKPKKEILGDIQILTPYRNGETPDTIFQINNLVEPIYNPQDKEAAEHSVSCGKPIRTFHVGDKVINRTNRSKTIVNGSIGEITDIHDWSKDIFAWTMEVDFDGEKETYIYEEFKTLELAYAITVHASQGSEYKNVVVGMMRGAGNREFLNRNLLYVAATRASEKLVLMGQISTYKQIAAMQQVPRRTALANWLKNLEQQYESGC